MKLLLWLAAILLALLALVGTAQGQTLRPLFDAIRQVESSGRANPPDGDGGKAIGPYQIWRVYWIDARMPDGTYEDCRNSAYAERVMLRYWQRYCPAALTAGDWQTLARVHNGGPRGASKKATLAYWHRVKAKMEEGKR